MFVVFIARQPSLPRASRSATCLPAEYDEGISILLVFSNILEIRIIGAGARIMSRQRPLVAEFVLECRARTKVGYQWR